MDLFLLRKIRKRFVPKLPLPASHDDRFFGADAGAGAAGDTGVLVERPGFGRAIHRQRSGGAFAGADRAVDAFGGILHGLAVVPGLGRLGGRRGFPGGRGGRRRRGRGGLGGSRLLYRRLA